jgi:hypothetical protein
MTPLIHFKAPRPRFARSINIERDRGGSAIDGYLPVGRAIDVIARLTSALNRQSVEVAISVTGPYGSGKSSLAVMIDALLGPSGDHALASAEEVVGQVSPEVLGALRSARRRLGAENVGFIRATATAQREPVAATVLRALVNGAERFEPSHGQKAKYAKALALLRKMYRDISGDQRARPETRTIRDAVTLLSELAPVLILIDEFGKNLEAFADDPSDADLFLLQELAEWTRSDGISLAVVTLQHMAFDEYATGTSAVQRREWAKIQGRFEDIPFIDTPAQTRLLIAAAFEEVHPKLQAAVNRWADAQIEKISELGSGDLSLDCELIERSWPLHPISLAILPDLCERYGQNERTLFSFLAGHEPRSVANFLADNDWKPRQRLPMVHLDRLYDYFVESAATMVSVSSAASRWMEIDSRIRDARAIDDAARRVLKTVGLLNLVSAGGTLRASRSVVCYAASDGTVGTSSSKDVSDQLVELERLGLITFRDFADEFRIWQGSDFDLKAAIDLSHRRIRDVPSARIVQGVLPLGALVAARHSHETGTLRAFERSWIDPNIAVIESLGSNDKPDGSALYVLGPDAPSASIEQREDAKPVAFLTTEDPTGVIHSARQVAAIDDVLATAEELRDDWVAYRELLERRLEAQAILDEEFEKAYGTAMGRSIWWTFIKPGTRARWVTSEWPSASSALSRVADLWYAESPIIRNDLVNRHDLTSQAAKARRLLIEAMLGAPSEEGLGIEGFGPERTLYLSVLRELGLHKRVDDVWQFSEPPSNSTLRPTWDRLVEVLRIATKQRKRVSDLYELLAAPPFGVRPGITSLLVVVSLILYADEVALYEHGTFKPILTDEICERLIRNPDNFEIKYFASRTGDRAELLTQVASHLHVIPGKPRRNGRVGSVLAVLSYLMSVVQLLPECVRRTSYLSEDAKLIRTELLMATEPDELFFSALPRALGKLPVTTTGGYEKSDLEDIADRLSNVTSELKLAYSTMLAEIRDTLQEQFRGPATGLREALSARARDISGKVIEPALSRLVVALIADIPGEDEWLEYVAMNVTGTPPGAWTDDDRRRFFSQIHDVGGTFRRIEALNADVRSRGESFDAMRVTVTRPDGVEAAKLVWVDEARKSALGPILEAALEGVRDHVNSDTEARDLLLAMLAEGDLISEKSDLHEADMFPTRLAKSSNRKGAVAT